MWCVSYRDYLPWQHIMKLTNYSRLFEILSLGIWRNWAIYRTRGVDNVILKNKEWGLIKGFDLNLYWSGYLSFCAVVSDNCNTNFACFHKIHAICRIALMDNYWSICVALRRQSIGKIHPLVWLKVKSSQKMSPERHYTADKFKHTNIQIISKPCRNTNRT